MTEKQGHEPATMSDVRMAISDAKMELSEKIFKLESNLIKGAMVLLFVIQIIVIILIGKIHGS